MGNKELTPEQQKQIEGARKAWDEIISKARDGYPDGSFVYEATELLDELLKYYFAILDADQSKPEIPPELHGYGQWEIYKEAQQDMKADHWQRTIPVI